MQTYDETQPVGRKGEIVEVHFLPDLREANRRAKEYKRKRNDDGQRRYATKVGWRSVRIDTCRIDVCVLVVRRKLAGNDEKEKRK